MSLTVIAKAKATPSGLEPLLKELQKVAKYSRLEKGCLSYQVHQSVEDSELVIALEEWKSKEDIQGHFNQPYIQTLFEKVPDWVAAAPEIVTFKRLD